MHRNVVLGTAIAELSNLVLGKTDFLYHSELNVFCYALCG
jgi:hypothetical protein